MGAAGFEPATPDVWRQRPTNYQSKNPLNNRLRLHAIGPEWTGEDWNGPSFSTFSAHELGISPPLVILQLNILSPHSDRIFWGSEKMIPVLGRKLLTVSAFIQIWKRFDPGQARVILRSNSFCQGAEWFPKIRACRGAVLIPWEIDRCQGNQTVILQNKSKMILSLKPRTERRVHGWGRSGS